MLQHETSTSLSLYPTTHHSLSLTLYPSLLPYPTTAAASAQGFPIIMILQNKVCHGSQGDSVKLVSTSSPPPLLCLVLHPLLCQGSHIGWDRRDSDWQALLIKVGRKCAGGGREQWGREGDGGTGRDVNRERGKKKGGAYERRRGWEAKGEQRRKRECGMQSEKYCNVTVSLNCCVGCLTRLIPQKQTGLTWD